MEKYKFSISIQADTQKEAFEKAKAVAELASYLSAETLTALANVVKNDPSKVALAKKFLGIR